MLKSLFSSFALLFALTTMGQSTFETELESIQSESQAEEFIQNNKTNDGEIIVFNKEKHKTQMAKELFKLGNGGSKVYANDMQKTHYKVIEKNQIPYYRVSYIYLDGKEKSASEIAEIRSKIISKYKQGFRFKDLAKMYSMDGNANRGGDLGWFTHGDMVPQFEEQVLNGGYAVNDIFTVDIPENDWYYVVLKTYGTKMIDEIKVLKITELSK